MFCYRVQHDVCSYGFKYEVYSTLLRGILPGVCYLHDYTLSDVVLTYVGIRSGSIHAWLGCTLTPDTPPPTRFGYGNI